MERPPTDATHQTALLHELQRQWPQLGLADIITWPDQDWEGEPITRAVVLHNGPTAAERLKQKDDDLQRVEMAVFDYLHDHYPGRFPHVWSYTVKAIEPYYAPQ